MTDKCALTYNYSHHNWFDEVIGQATEAEHHLSLTFQPEGDPVSTPWVWTFELWSTDGLGNNLETPAKLNMVACQQLPSGNDCMEYFVQGQSR